MSFWNSIKIVWLRYFAVFRKNLVYGVVTTFVEPLLYLLAFGFGLGQMIGEVRESQTAVSYRAFVLAGMIGQTVLFTAFFEAAYGGFVRMYYQKVFQAISVTQVTLSEVLWGELLWCASRAVFSTSIVLIIGVAIGDFSWQGSLLVLPLSFIGGLIFAAMGMLVAALSRTIESISYPQYLLVFPMFLFCGVYFPLTNLPEIFRGLAWLLPLTSLLSMARSLVLGMESSLWAPALTLFWLLLLVPLARNSMKRRLIA